MHLPLPWATCRFRAAGHGPEFASLHKGEGLWWQQTSLVKLTICYLESIHFLLSLQTSRCKENISSQHNYLILASEKDNLEQSSKKCKNMAVGKCLVVQWLGLRALTAKGLGSVPARGTKVPFATWWGQKKKKKAVFRCQFSHTWRRRRANLRGMGTPKEEERPQKSRLAWDRK